MTYAKTGRINDAIVEMQRTLRLDPGDRDAETQLKSLQAIANAPDNAKHNIKETSASAI
jgi:hypothetical protein